MRKLFWALAFWAMALQPGAGFAQTQAAAGGKLPAAFVFCYQGHVPDGRIVVVDKSRQRLVVLRYVGKLVAEYEYPCATGENSGNKQESGDERTPEGVYFTTKRYKDNKITIFGNRALHLNYPNAFDVRAGRRGNGIFIHGTNKALKPRSTNGCVVLRNEDLTVVASLVKDQQTPIVVMDRFELADQNARTKACNFLARLNPALLDRGKAPMPDTLALRDLPRAESTLKALQRALPQQTLGLARKVRLKTLGTAVFGVGERWVLMAEQIARERKGPALQLTRRYYLEAIPGDRMDLVQGEWIVGDAESAAWLVKRVLADKHPVTVAAKKSGPQPAPKAKPAPKPKPKEANSEVRVRRMLHLWISAWEKKQLKRYMAYYDRDFKSDGMDKKAWRNNKAKLNRYYKTIQVRAENLRIAVSGNRAKVSFLQHYRSDWHRDKGIKTMHLVNRSGRWRILSEQWEPMKKPANAG